MANVSYSIEPRSKTLMIRGPVRPMVQKCMSSILLGFGSPLAFMRLLSMLRLRTAGLAAMGLSLLMAQAAQADVIVTFEAPGVQTSSALNRTTIDFNSVGTGYHGSQTFTLPGPLTATYSGTQFVNSADQYGGAGGAGNYLAIQATNSVTLNLNAPQAYFGLWLSAADSANQLELFGGNLLVGSFSGAGPAISSLPGTYLGNPNSQFLGDNPTEKYVFINFYAHSANDEFNTIVFTNLAGATTCESDNHTFSSTLHRNRSRLHHFRRPSAARRDRRP